MNRKNLLIIGILILLSLGGKKVYDMTRGLRNNNPGNIRRTGDQWQGLSAKQNDDAFFQFTDAVYGIRALAKILRNYQVKYGLNTVQELISRWAPPVENDTGAYVRHVASLLNVPADERLDTADLGTLTTLVNGIIKHENGVNPYPESIINKGVGMALA